MEDHVVRGITKKRYARETRAVRKAEERLRKLEAQAHREEQRRMRAEEKLIRCVRVKSLAATKQHGVRHEAIILAFRSERKPDLRLMVPVLIDSCWFDSLSHRLWFLAGREPVRKQNTDEPVIEGTVYCRDEADFSRLLHRYIPGALHCRVTFENGNRLDCRRANLKIHRHLFGDELNIRHMAFQQRKAVRDESGNVVRDPSTGQPVTVPVRMVVFSDIDLDGSFRGPDGEEMDRHDYLIAHALDLSKSPSEMMSKIDRPAVFRWTKAEVQK